MGFVGKIKKAIKKHKIAVSLAHPVGAAYVLGEKARRKFERNTKLGKSIKQMYNPRVSQPVMYNSASAYAYQPRRISSLMGGAS